MRRAQVVAVVSLLLTLLMAAQPARAEDPTGHPSFHRTWARTDYPVKNQNTVRTWMWGGAAITPYMLEEYDQSPGTQRQVVYFDKARMEVTHPEAVDDGVWFITTGLLVLELVNGQIQVGDNRWLP